MRIQRIIAPMGKGEGNDMLEKLVELLEPYMSGEPCDAESGSCELTNCRTCDAIALASRIILHDVVPVVRCKDCKHTRKKTSYEEALYIEETVMCIKEDPFGGTADTAMMPDDFCSYGEKRGEG